MLDHGLPDLAVEQGARVERGIHQLGALGEDTTGSQRVVTDLAVTHVVVARESNGRPMGQQLGGEFRGGQGIEAGGVGHGHGVAGVGRGDADAVGDHQQQRAGTGGERFEPLQCERHATECRQVARGR
jgi:hypothetical protein